VVGSTVDLDDPPGVTQDVAGRPRSRGDRLRTAVRGLGHTLLTLGFICLLFVVYELYVTDLLAAREQDELSQELAEQWADDPTVTPPGSAPSPGTPEQAPAPAPESAPPPAPETFDVSVGQPFAVLHIPRLGEDYSRAIVEGTAQVQLAQGPGHYVGTALPGQEGNFAVAGHRVGRGSPFLDLDRMRPGDPIVVETAANWYVYRVLGDPATGDFGADPSGIPGQEIVAPVDVAVISATPGGPADAAATGSYLTLTTCHPKYSAQQRLVVHARLDGTPLDKAIAPEGPPALLG
jgi:sortase (surface protein transpeptidase)